MRGERVKKYLGFSIFSLIYKRNIFKKLDAIVKIINLIIIIETLFLYCNSLESI